MFSFVLSLDTKGLIFMRSLIGPEGAKIVQFTGELIVLWGALFLLGLWISGIKEKNEEKKIDALKIFLSIVLVFGIYAILNLGIPQFRPNPQLVAGGIQALIPHPIDNSFPSGHGLFSGALFAGIYIFRKNAIPFLIITLIIALITGISRVIGGVHYPGDILAGYIIGFIGVLLLQKTIESSFFEKNVYPLFLKVAKIIHL